MRICVSACLLGERCKYNGGDNGIVGLAHLFLGHEVVTVCPEVLGGLPTPRSPAELRAGRVLNTAGEDVTAPFDLGVRRALERARTCDLALLQPRSPSCGVNRIYDGTFSGTLILGSGLFARALAREGIPAFDCDALTDAERALACVLSSRTTGVEGDE